MVHPLAVASRDLRRRIERLGGLPLRAETARALSDRPGDDVEEASDESAAGPSRGRSPLDLDPGWAVIQGRRAGPIEPLEVVAETPWWPCQSRSRPGAEALARLWRHTVAVSLACARLAREAEHPSPATLGRLGLLHNLGLWAVAAVDDAWLVTWSSMPELERRREFERASLGQEAAALGRSLAERWGLGRAAADAAWLHAEPGVELELDPRSPETTALRLVQQAFRQAEQTPWALGPSADAWVAPANPRLKILIAEVQARCAGPFVDPEAHPREEYLTRENARLRRRVAVLEAGKASRDRFLDAMASADPAESPESWAERAGLAWCGEPGVSAARVEWTGPDSDADATEPVPASAGERPADVEVPLTTAAGPRATVRLWTIEPGAGSSPPPPAFIGVLPAWRAWAAQVAERGRLADRLDLVHRSLRHRVETEAPRLHQAKLDALAEFAAGAGHELNNPLAVIVGRAQLLLTRETDPHAQRSLRAILTQAQRAHRILRDLMYVARPPQPRPRFCLPEEIWKASLRDARADADERGVHLIGEGVEPGKRVWADPDGLRHLADALLRNAIEATPPGGTVRVAASTEAAVLRWTVDDNGRGVTPTEAAHLFDPFYCGRQAGRGLGMGLSRASRFVTLLGGEITWRSAPGLGASFSIRVPLEEPPKPPAADALGPAALLDHRSPTASFSVSRRGTEEPVGGERPGPSPPPRGRTRAATVD